MSKKHHSPGPIPSGNRSRSGKSNQSPDEEQKLKKEGVGSNEAFQEEDPKRRMGDFTGTADHSRQQPGPLNDGGKMHSEDSV